MKEVISELNVSLSLFISLPILSYSLARPARLWQLDTWLTVITAEFTNQTPFPAFVRREGGEYTGCFWPIRQFHRFCDSKLGV